jgi:integrase
MPSGERIVYDVTEGIASPETRRKYAYNFQCFLSHFDGITPETLLQKEPKVTEAMIIQWIKYLSGVRKQKHDTIHNEVAAVIHFFEWNDVIMNKRKINRSIPQDAEIRQDRHYTHEEIQRILEKCDERSKVIILLMASTGMRLGALPGLKFCDISNIPDYNLYKIQVYARTRDSYYTFATPECSKSIDAYRVFREIKGETITDNAPLIREQFDIRLRFAAAKPIPVQIRGLETILFRLLRRAEAKSDSVMRSHGLRKFYVSQCIKAGMDYNAREYLVGHKHSRGLDVHYDRTTEQDRLQEYLKAVDLLTINSEYRIKQELEEKYKDYALVPKQEWESIKEDLFLLRKVLDSVP